LSPYDVGVLNTFSHSYDSVNPNIDHKDCYPKIHIHPNNIYIPKGIVSFPIELKLSHPYLKETEITNPLIGIKDQEYFETFPEKLTFGKNLSAMIYVKIKKDFHHMEFDLDLKIKIRKLKFYNEAFLDFLKLKELVD